MLLTKPALLRAIGDGRIVVDPYDPQSVGTNSIDVRLGTWLVRQRHAMVLNPWNERSSSDMWCPPERASTVGELLTAKPHLRRDMFEPFGLEQRVVMLAPGECVLSHTEEVIGSTDLRIVAKMQARSSMGRSNVTVCADAGVGDVRWVSRWTVELHNRNPHSYVVLGCGMRIAQLVFFEGEAIDESDAYPIRGKYQAHAGRPGEVVIWRPDDMLPRAYKDREVRRAGAHAAAQNNSMDSPP